MPTQSHVPGIPFVTINLRTGWVLAVLLGLTALLSCAGLAVIVGKYMYGHQHMLGAARLFSLDSESSAPTWFSSVLLLSASVAAGAASLHARAERPARPLAFALLGLLFLVMSCDEVAGFHENLIYPLRGLGLKGGIFHFGWVLPGMIALAITTLKGHYNDQRA